MINPFKEKSMDTMINFSGGIDSVYVAWRYLTENPNKILLIHHVVLKTREKRWHKGKVAVNEVLAWFKKKGLDNFEYVETSVDISNLYPRMFDSTLTDFMQIAILRCQKYSTVVNVLNNTPKNEYERLGEAELERRWVIPREFRKVTKTDYINTIPKLKDMYKIDIIRDMPKELFELCWYCRRPTASGGTCGQCHTCKQVEKALYDLKREK